MTREEMAQRARRAREVLDGASWVFDEVVAQAQRDWLEADDPHEGMTRREELFRRANAALRIKAHLMTIVNAQEAQEKLDERRERRDQ